MKASGLTLENFFLFAHVFLIDLFIVIFFPVDNEHLHNSFLSLCLLLLFHLLFRRL